MVWMPEQQIFNGYYTIERELGKGGFGITYLVRDPRGELEVVKTLNSEIRQSQAKYNACAKGFYDEASRLLKLYDAHRSNPWIRHMVKVIHLFKESEIPCFAMEHIDGGTLRNRLKMGVISEADAVRWIEQVGRALELVHREGLLHRDIKPDNIMLRSDGSAVLIDFGIAREFRPELTAQTHTVMGSEGYAPPEQHDERAQRGPFTDVYALAATLYELLSGVRPQVSWRRLQKDEMQPLQLMNLGVSDRVCEAVMEGLRLDGRLRPRSVGQWLGRLLGEETLPLTSEETIPLPQTLPLPKDKRHEDWECVPAYAHYVDRLAFSPDGKLLATYCGNSDEFLKIWDVESRKEICKAKYEDFFTNWGEADFTKKELAVLMNESLSFSRDGKTLNWNGYICTWEASKLIKTETLTSPFEEYLRLDLAVSPDLQLVAFESTNETRDKVIKLWKTSTKTEIHTISFEEEVREFYDSQFSSDGTIFSSLIWFKNYDCVIVPGRQGAEKIKLWEVETGRELCSIPLPDVLAETKFTGTYTISPDNRLLASNCGDPYRRVIFLFDIETGKELYRFQCYGEKGSVGLDRVVSLIFSPDSQFLASTDSTGTTILWKIQKGLYGGITVKKTQNFVSEHLPVINKYPKSSRPCAFSPDGQTLAIGFSHKYGNITLWDIKNGHILNTCIGHRTLNRRLADGGVSAVSPNGKIIAINDDYHDTIQLWDTQSGLFIQALKYESNRFKLDRTKVNDDLDRQFDGIGILTFSQNGDFLIGVIDSYAHHITKSKIIVWRILTGEQVESKCYPDHLKWGSWTVNQYGDLIAFFEYPTNYNDPLRVQILQARIKKVLCILEMEHKGQCQIDFSPNKCFLAIRQSASEVELWEIETGRLVQTFRIVKKPDNYENERFKHPMLFSPNSKILAISSPQNITLWCIETGECLDTIEYSCSQYSNPCLTFSPDSQTLAFDQGSGIKFWDIKNHCEIYKFNDRCNGKIHYIYDGQILLSNSDGIKLWQRK